MSETQIHATAIEPQLGDRWGDAISTERATELEARQQRWEDGSDRDGRAGPFAQLPLTGADVFWLATRARLAALAEGGASPEEQARSGPDDAGHYPLGTVTFPNIDALPRDEYVRARAQTVRIIRGGVHLETLYVNTCVWGRK
jgi:hypothetical protein